MNKSLSREHKIGPIIIPARLQVIPNVRTRSLYNTQERVSYRLRDSDLNKMKEFLTKYSTKWRRLPIFMASN